MLGHAWLGRLALAACVLGLSAACATAAEPPSDSRADNPVVNAPPPGLDAEGVAAWTTWQHLDIDDYRYRLTVGCFCMTVDGPVVVSDGEVTRVAGKRYDGGALTGFSDGAPTVDEVFRVLSRALKHADQVDVAYDPGTGVPRSIDVDWMKNTIDDEISYRLGKLIADAP